MRCWLCFACRASARPCRLPESRRCARAGAASESSSSPRGRAHTRHTYRTKHPGSAGKGVADGPSQGFPDRQQAQNRTKGRRPLSPAAEEAEAPTNTRRYATTRRQSRRPETSSVRFRPPQLGHARGKQPIRPRRIQASPALQRQSAEIPARRSLFNGRGRTRPDAAGTRSSQCRSPFRRRAACPADRPTA